MQEEYLNEHFSSTSTDKCLSRTKKVSPLGHIRIITIIIITITIIIIVITRKEKKCFV